MKLSILQPKLKRAIQTVEKVVSKTTTLPILNNILLKTEKNFLKLSATDLEIGINRWVLAKIENEGAITIPVQPFSQLVSFLPPESINLISKDSILSIEEKKIKSQIKGFPGEEFPVIPEVKKEEKVSLEGTTLAYALSQINGIPSFSNIRPEISGIFFQVKKQELILTATDAFRLGEKRISWYEEPKIEKDYSFILPQKAVSHLINILAQKEKVDLYLSPNLVMFETEMEEIEACEVQLVSKLIEGDYPDYQEIIPKTFKTKAKILKEELLKQIKSASIFASRNNEINLIFSPKKNEIEIRCENPEIGSYQAKIKGEIEGEKIEIFFNYRFLLDGILNIKDPEIFLGCSKEKDEYGPALLKGVKDKSYLYVVMPIQH